MNEIKEDKSISKYGKRTHHQGKTKKILIKTAKQLLF